MTSDFVYGNTSSFVWNTAKPIIVDMLTKGIANVFFEPKERKNLVETLSTNIKNVPFMPVGKKKKKKNWHSIR